MKIVKLLIVVLITGACAAGAYAQKFKYVPQTVKGTKSVPYVVNPKLSPALRTNLAVSVVRPQAIVSVAPAVERRVVARLTAQQRMVRLQANLNQLEEFARTHHHQLPQTTDGTAMGDLRRNILTDIIFLKRYHVLEQPHPLFQRYDQLLKLNQMQVSQQERIERLQANLEQLEEYARTHDNQLPKTTTGTAMGDLRRQIVNDIVFLKKYNVLEKQHPLFQRYDRLVELSTSLPISFQERIERLQTNLEKLEEFVGADRNKLPQAQSKNQWSNLRQQIIGDISFLKSHDILPPDHPLFERYNRLVGTEKTQITPQERLERLQANLEQLEEYARTHDHKLPLTYAGGEFSDLRNQVINDIGLLKRFGEAEQDHPLFQRYNQLLQTHQQQVKQESQQTATVLSRQILQERTSRLKANLERLEEFARTHNHKLPQMYPGSAWSDLRSQVIGDIAYLRIRGLKEDPLVVRYEGLLDMDKQQRKLEQHQIFVQRSQQRRQLAREVRQQEMSAMLREEQEALLRERAWEEEQVRKQQQAQAEIKIDEITDANAAAVATMVEGSVLLEGNTVTDEYIDELLRFYNKLDPLGTGEIQ